jgi:hypothetical protein
MPIRINLLAEEQAAEEMRRRDPIKRALYLGVALLILMIAWIAVTQMNVRAARSELAGHEVRLTQLDELSKQVRANQLLAGEADSKVQALEKYSTNRHFWGSLLDAVQHTSVGNVRLMEIRSEQKYSSGGVNKFFTTNMTVKYTPPVPWWKFWGRSGQAIPVSTLVSNKLNAITNSLPFTTNILDYKVSTTLSSTNLIQNLVNVSVEFSNVPWAMEEIVVELRGRDYGSPHGAAIDEFALRINQSPYFKELLEPGQGLRFTERPPQPRPDPQDPVNPNALFVPFTIELSFKERIFTNE